MATEKQKTAARENIKKAQKVGHAKGTRKSAGGGSAGMSTAERDSVEDTGFAFPKQRKEPLNDAKHVRNAVARFDQVEGVTDSERDQAWRRIRAAAKKFDVEISAETWRDLPG